MEPPTINLPDAAAAPAPPRRPLTAILCWAYPVLVAAVWGTMYLGADAWWPATLLAFGPRWVWLIPVPPLLALAIFRRKKLAYPVVGGTILCIVAVMGFRISPTSSFESRPGPHILRVMSLNAHRRAIDVKALRDLLLRTRPQVIVFQDWSDQIAPGLPRELFPYSRRDGELFIASRYRIHSAEDLRLSQMVPPGPDEVTRQKTGNAVCCHVDLPGGTIHVINLHLASPHGAVDELMEKGIAASPALEASSRRREAESMAVRSYAAAVSGPVVIAGDFNTPVESCVYREAWSDWLDGFSEAGTGLGLTYITRRVQLRIDHVLGSHGWRFQHCWVGPTVGSPHRPLFADLEWRGPKLSVEE